MSFYEKVIIIGYGKITGKIIQYVHRFQKKYEYSIAYIEYEPEMFGTSRKICEELQCDYYKIEDKDAVTEYFQKETKRCLIISASNNYMFPRVLTENPQYTIINFHNALLPKFPGRNAPSWAIFEKETETGITWHYVTERIDGGDIIIQKKCIIDPNARAYELSDELMQLAYEGFCERFSEIIENKVKAVKQQISEKRRLYKSTDYPGNCSFSIEDPTEYIYRLLRSVDYGKYSIFPPVLMKYQGKNVRIVRYRRVSPKKVEEVPGRIYLPFDGGDLLRLSWVEANHLH